MRIWGSNNCAATNIVTFFGGVSCLNSTFSSLLFTFKKEEDRI